ncbi:hypothetical protein B0I72DRAFT_6786 [Yarrowia lipolytica]|uniref:YALI0E04004p n=2 Tax=Yarrowia lipolytica TaxID=4952 RepID=Q6C739_YARLI|nr:YALI0E04004p [Yarrowia lipolytica CLIB122]AOW04923.1 hypothetical protein YALI1_E04795g [Yarrowia lipolytica]KAB8286249.1 hypothetical protein BKA91DRAFT_14544 [Yarrowia lipolytica]KAE8174697.1 hypothetical protein BKA90DRAFT_33685 [Yarrowia lipolytica]KAJ8056500.1 hypothetical protein LXG23DRAFT_15351 [Yarrowia lipolytica]QNP98777.1 Hypothetical protein YALI2_E00093g [Yarrowia lipolytica]|eukprot:XP_503523.1 YALI0E04004p [Yarrowia lipolytica CLIB122]
MQLPPELITLVATFLDFKDLSRLTCVNKHLYELLATDIWKDVYYSAGYVPPLLTCAPLIQHVHFDSAVTTMFFNRKNFPAIKQFSVSYYEDITPWIGLPVGTVFRNWRRDLYQQFYPQLAEYLKAHEVTLASLLLYDQSFLYYFIEADSCHKIERLRFDTNFTDTVLYHDKVYPPILRLAIVEKFIRAVEAAGCRPPFDRDQGSLSFWNQIEDIERGPDGPIMPPLPADFGDLSGERT